MKNFNAWIFAAILAGTALPWGPASRAQAAALGEAPGLNSVTHGTGTYFEATNETGKTVSISASVEVTVQLAYLGDYLHYIVPSAVTGSNTLIQR